jgi:outer membrane receptor protein involved in Fe transport
LDLQLGIGDLRCGDECQQGLRLPADYLSRTDHERAGCGIRLHPASFCHEYHKGIFPMVTPLKFAGLLLMTSALVAPAALAQTAPVDPMVTPPAPAPVATDATAAPAMDAAAEPAAPAAPTAEPIAQAEAEQPAEEAPEVSIPGGDIVVVGRRSANIEKNAPAVVAVLSSADIARTGEGDIAGALSRVTGLSVVGNGYVYVRGLGDRYSAALLNGSPLPSPEPLKRVVPLDLFPTNVIASSLVQKSYSANFPGEFGGGIINLTTKAVPKESFLSFGAGTGGNGETSGYLGYVYYGAKSDWSGFDDGTRNTPPALASFFASGKRIGDLGVDQPAIIGEIATPRNAVIQRNTAIPFNGSASVTGGTSFDVGEARLGVIATAGWSNKWRTRDILQQDASSADLSTKERDFQRVVTENQVVVNAMLGIGLELGEHKFRWTNLFIRDTVKQTRLGVGTKATSAGFNIMQQDTAWYERQLLNTQLTAELEFGDLSIDMRGSYANSQREAPYELSFEYVKTNRANDPFGAYYINRLNGNFGRASFTFSDLSEDLWSFGVDATYPIIPDVTATVGYAYVRTKRRSERRDFEIRAPSDLPEGIGLLRPDFLIGKANADYFNYLLFENTETDPSFNAQLRNHGAYGQLQAELGGGFSLNAGVRYEKARQSVRPAQVFAALTNTGASTTLRNNYWLPTATLTYAFGDNMQLRVSGSKTIARPQFRELIFQQFYDPESNTTFQGNPQLVDSTLINGEARFEWYFAREQRVSIAGFYKKIDNPIEAYVSPIGDNSLTTSFANAPSAQLYGAEVETQKYWPLDTLGEGAFWSTRRLVTIANYTYTKSKLKVGAGDIVNIFGVPAQAATNLFRNGSALTGQSDHLVNLQIGLENTERLSQQTFLINYSSKRVTRRGLFGQPDIIEKPGLSLDFVARQGIMIWGVEAELKAEARNITGTKYQELQDNGTNRVFYNRYKQGTSYSLSLSVDF